MSIRLQTQVKARSVLPLSFTPVQTGFLQRKCACGQHIIAGGECTECRQKRLGMMQRAAVSAAPVSSVPAIVHEVLSSPGQPLDGGTRAFMEPRFGYDFSRVRVHTDARAAESARAVNALAYTAGRDVVFAEGEYEPGTSEGRGLLAHELTHVVQQVRTQSSLQASSVQDVDGEDLAEREADAVTMQVLNGGSVPQVANVSPSIQRVKEPYISKVTVDLTSQNVSLTWKGKAPSEPGSDSFTCSAGKGYSDPGDPPGTCTRDCCSGADVQCASPYDAPKAVGSCCTPIGSNFWTGRPRPEHNGWKYWTPVEPIHTSGGRGIALHQHNTVTGQPIGHGCIRMDEPNAERIFRYSSGKATNVTITGKATVDCPVERQCQATGTQEGKKAALPLTHPDEEVPGSGGGGAVLPAIASEEVLV